VCVCVLQFEKSDDGAQGNHWQTASGETMRQARGQRLKSRRSLVSERLADKADGGRFSEAERTARPCCRLLTTDDKIAQLYILLLTGVVIDQKRKLLPFLQGLLTEKAQTHPVILDDTISP